MNIYFAELAGRAVPRYTSYPTAAEFHDGVCVRQQREALAAIPPETPVSLYMHIPYCHEICWYCGCNTGAAGKPERLSAYVDALLAEVQTVSALLRGKITSVHFGGGSPNALSQDDFRKVVEELRARFTLADEIEIAVELDPRSLDRAYCRMLGDVGVTRASLGVQTFSSAIQRRINRVQPAAQIWQAVHDLREAGIDHVNFDLLYGLPGQTCDDVADTISEAARLAPDRIAMFGYAHMPRMLPRQRMIDASDLPGAKERLEQSMLGRSMLLFAGYEAIGFDHFAKPGDSLAVAASEGRLHRNFQGYTDDTAAAVIGLGSSAISQFKGLLVQNEKHVGRYRLNALSGSLTGVRGAVRSTEAQLRGAVIERFLCDGLVDVEAVAETMKMTPQSLIPGFDSLAELAALGIVTIDGWRIRLAEWAWPYARLAASAFDEYRAPSEQRFSRAV